VDDTVDTVDAGNTKIQDIQDYILKLKKLIELEREAEIEAVKSEIRRLSGEKREKLGRAILNLNGKIVGQEFGYRLVRYGRRKEFETEIGVGDLVLISRGDPLKSDLMATVVEKGKRYITVAVESIPAWALKNVRIDLYVNEITFRRMLENLDSLTENGIKALKFLLGLKNPEVPEKVDFQPFDEQLNASQKEAVSLALGSKDFFLIHGPFGTGKTRTAAEIILQEGKRGNKVLATAESNIAVDNLVERLFGKARIVRLGHPSRISRHLIESSLFYQLEQHKRFREVKELREKAEEVMRARDRETKPSPQWRRGLSDEEIVRLAKRGGGMRGVPANVIQSMARWIELNREVQNLLASSRRIEEDIMEEIVQEAQVILATNSTAALINPEKTEFDVAVVDEASQTTTPSLLIPVVRAKRFVLAGDHRQLPPTVLSQEAKELMETMFEELIESYPANSRMLEIQYRMNEKLMEFPSKEFYGGRLKAHDDIKNISLKDLGIGKASNSPFWSRVLNCEPLVFIDTSKCSDKWERQRRGSYSRENPREAQIVKKVVEKLLQLGVKKEWIGVISPYDDQVDQLRQMISGVEISTVDGYQGREKEVIIISFVRSNKHGELGFLEDLRRLNVSLTRARRKLIAIGDSSTLKTHETYRRFIEFVKRKGSFVEYCW
jgi:predicted DNA helicase